jgi:hypothetical protein
MTLLVSRYIGTQQITKCHLEEEEFEEKKKKTEKTRRGRTINGR